MTYARFIVNAALWLSMCYLSPAVVRAETTAAAPIYKDDPEVVAKLKALKPGESLVLKTTYWKDGKPISGAGRQGPYARDYTNKMVYAPERETALYSGGNHGAGRTNDVWEYHLGSNTWHQLHESDGGDHARFKFSLMFYPRMLDKDPEKKFDEKQEKELAECKAWWNENVTLVDGNFVMKKTHAPLLMGHTWDTLMYDPVNKRLVHGTGAHCAESPQLQHKFAGEPLEQVKAKIGKRKDGTPWRRPWTFDPATKKWSPYANESEIPELRGMGASLLYISDLKKAIYFYAGQNTPGADKMMAIWDLTKDTWEKMSPNGTTDMGKLGLGQKIAPISEQQMVYASGQKKIIAVLNNTTYAYDFPKNEWSKLNDAVPFRAMDADTVFAYDSKNDVCLLASPRDSKLAVFDIKQNEWRMLEIEGKPIPKPPYCVGFGYYDSKHNVLVVRPAYSDSMWFYRYK